jgi:hypothetical protein
VIAPRLHDGAEVDDTSERGHDAGAAPELLGSVSPGLEEALNDPGPATALGLSAFPAAFKGTTHAAAVEVFAHVAPGSLSFHESDGQQRSDLEIALVPVDARERRTMARASS